MIRSILLMLTMTGLICCGRSDFDEYPPEEILSKESQRIMLDGFIRSAYDTVGSLSSSDINDLHKQYKIQYYVQKDSIGYYLITYDGNIFFKNESYHFYGGTIAIDSSADSVFRVQFERESFRTDDDSIKLLFEMVMANKDVAYWY